MPGKTSMSMASGSANRRNNGGGGGGGGGGSGSGGARASLGGGSGCASLGGGSFVDVVDEQESLPVVVVSHGVAGLGGGASPSPPSFPPPPPPPLVSALGGGGGGPSVVNTAAAAAAPRGGSGSQAHLGLSANRSPAHVISTPAPAPTTTQTAGAAAGGRVASIARAWPPSPTQTQPQPQADANRAAFGTSYSPKFDAAARATPTSPMHYNAVAAATAHDDDIEDGELLEERPLSRGGAAADSMQTNEEEEDDDDEEEDNDNDDRRGANTGEGSRHRAEESWDGGDADSAESSEPSEDEGVEGYRRGGYHYVRVNDVYGPGESGARYRVLEKLGWGHFSTVWLVRSTNEANTLGALKVQKSAEHYTEAARDEMAILRQIARGDPKGDKNVVRLLDSFDVRGPNGLHVCMVFEPLGDNLLSLIKRYDYHGVPLEIVRNIARQLLVALDYLHREHSVIHTDLKPENVLLTTHLRWRAKGKPGAARVIANAASRNDAELETAATENARRQDTYAHGDDDEDADGHPRRNHPSGEEAGAGDEDVAMKPVKEAWVQNTPDGSALAAPSAEAPDRTMHAADAQTSAPAPREETSTPNGGGSSLTKNQKKKLKKKAKKSTGGSSKQTSGAAGSSSAPTGGSGVKTKGKKRRKKGSAAQKEGARAAHSHGGGGAAAEEAVPLGTPARRLASSWTEEDRQDYAREEDELTRARIKVVDLGNACWTYKQFTQDIQTRQYRCPEVIIGRRYSTSADMWSLACLLFELATGDLLFDPKSGTDYTRDDDHLALMLELLGPIPKHFSRSGKYSRDFFHRNGELRAIKKLRFWPLAKVLQEKYEFSAEKAADFASFLEPMLDYIPENRATAAMALHHRWLRDHAPAPPPPSSAAAPSSLPSPAPPASSSRAPLSAMPPPPPASLLGAPPPLEARVPGEFIKSDVPSSMRL
ncbi:serine/threonine-protein kinase SRPK3 [Pseudoscourfieldia marina]